MVRLHINIEFSCIIPPAFKIYLFLKNCMCTYEYLYVHMYITYIYVCASCAYLVHVEVRKGSQSSGTGVIRPSELPCGGS